MRKSHLKLLKLAKRTTINYEETSEEDKNDWQGPLKLLGYIRKIAEGAGKGYEMDQKVLASLVDRDSYNKLTNNTINLKALKENEIKEIFSQKPTTQNQVTDDDLSLQVESLAVGTQEMP